MSFSLFLESIVGQVAASLITNAILSRKQKSVSEYRDMIQQILNDQKISNITAPDIISQLVKNNLLSSEMTVIQNTTLNTEIDVHNAKEVIAVDLKGPTVISGAKFNSHINVSGTVDIAIGVRMGG